MSIEIDRPVSVGIATFTDALNYGALLQSYALGSFLSSLGYQVFYVNRNNEGKVRNNKKNIIKRLFYALIVEKRKSEKNDQFERFKSENYSFVKSANEVDILVCGSDQIWNPEITKGFDQLFFGGTCNFSVAYAASCGDLSVLMNKTDEFFLKLSNFDSVSSREEDLSRFITVNTGLDCPVVCDPVFLPDLSVYKEIEKESFEEKRYLLIYQMNKDKFLYKLAKYISSKFHLDIVEINNDLYDCRLIKSNCYYSVSLETFLSLIDHSSFVITNSFHGTALSILYKKPFFSIKSNKRNSRISSLCNSLGLGDRFIDSGIKLSSLDLSAIDYGEVSKKVEFFSDSSKQYLKETLLKISEKINVK